MSRLEGKNFLVTGAANGIGAAACRKLISEGARVAGLDIDTTGLKALTDELGADRFIAFEGSAADLCDIEAARDGAVESWGGLDGGLFCAGMVGTSAPIHEYPIDLYDRIMNLNVRGSFLGLKTIVPALEKRGGGSVLFVSSINGIKGFASFSAYATSKQAVTGLMKTASIDLAARNIRVNSIHPGLTSTQMMRDVEEIVSPDDLQAAHDSFAAIAALKRYADPSEIATSIAFLLSDEASYITGSMNVIDGGFTTGIAGA